MWLAALTPSVPRNEGSCDFHALIVWSFLTVNLPILYYERNAKFVDDGIHSLMMSSIARLNAFQITRPTLLTKALDNEIVSRNEECSVKYLQK